MRRRRRISAARAAPGLFFTFASAFPGCAFDFGDEPRPPNTCDSDRDCLSLEACSALTGACVLRGPEPAVVEGRLRGAFRCVPGEAPFGGASLGAAWPDSSSNGYLIPGAEAQLTHRCVAAAIPEAGPWVVALDGPRRFDPTWGAMMFYRVLLLVPTVAITTDGPPKGAGGSLYVCPGFPSEVAWSNFSLDPCYHLFALGDDTTVDFVVARLEGEGEGLVAGTLDATLVPQVVLPEGE